MKKLVFITGGTRGIGKGIVNSFVAAGYQVAFSYINNEQLANEIVASNSEIIFATYMDQSNEKSIHNAVIAIEKRFDQTIDILVNNAAISQEKPFEKITSDDWKKMLATNLEGPFLLTQKLLPSMLESGWGRIINISSIGGQWGGFNQVHYAAAKSGLINLTQSIAKIYSNKGITSNAIAIGLVATDMTENELLSEVGRKKVESIPIGRLGTIEEIAKIVLFLASDDAMYLTGQTLNPNGGLYFG